ncbi:MAG: GFA family protein [Gammaproteobacteria bacterium]|nr:GFA family protein [Gammaproteobacteria bacterium]MDH4255214.1 GFA family protein [Gammaproteobacteria bacterium]MDH5308768.1 GFA family protein [Gammaproteobacteria bacterium]
MTRETLMGGCLCGAIRFEISGELRTFLHCHCRRCRKATGTGHATNLILVPDSVRWTAGEDLLASYKVPDAARFRTVFCPICGSPLPRVAPDLSMAVVPAGSLDSEPLARPLGRIFWDSRAGWSCDQDELPAWAEYPQG